LALDTPPNYYGNRFCFIGTRYVLCARGKTPTSDNKVFTKLVKMKLI
jgi:hypothetical protein